jgi:hypothetical protein
MPPSPQAFPDLLAYNAEWSYFPLSEEFVTHLKSWKPQTISFLDLPQPIRERIHFLNYTFDLDFPYHHIDDESRGENYIDQNFLYWARQRDTRSPWQPYIHQSRYYPLHQNFHEALQSWLRQSVSFLDLPPEIRNRIYELASEVDRAEDTPNLFSPPRYLFGWSRSGLMGSCVQVRREFMPVFIMSLEPTMRLQHFGERDALREVAWLKAVGPTLTAHTRQLRVRSHMVNPTLRWTETVVLRILVDQDGYVAVSTDFDQGNNQELLGEMKVRLTESMKCGLTGLMGYEEFRVVYEVCRKYSTRFATDGASEDGRGDMHSQ